MGIKLVQLTQTIYWLQMIPDRTDRLVLHAMATTALDSKGSNGEPPCVYWAGREFLMMCLYDGTVPEVGSSEYLSRSRQVRRCLARLNKAGAVEVIDQGRNGHNSRYRLTLQAGLRNQI